MEQYTIGVDLGGTTITAGLVDKDHNIVDRASCLTGLPRPSEEVEQEIAGLCRQLAEKHKFAMSDLKWVGIGTPGSVNSESGVVEFNANFGYNDWALQANMEKLLGCKVYIENDANAAAWGEAIAGAAKGTRNSVMITLGTGVGGGIIIDGKIYSGFNYAGAELGHVVIQKDGAPCSCGRRGCWEAYSSATALIRMTEEKLEECRHDGRETLMAEDVRARGKVSGKTAFDAMRKGDAAAEEVINVYLDYLACGLASIINIFQPEVLSIGGGISNEGDSLIALLEPRVRKEQYGGGLVPLTHIRIAMLKNDAGIIGAAVLGM